MIFEKKSQQSFIVKPYNITCNEEQKFHLRNIEQTTNKKISTEDYVIAKTDSSDVTIK